MSRKRPGSGATMGLESVTGGAAPAIRKLRSALSTSPVYMGLILLALIGVFSVLRPDTFLSVFNIRNIILDASVLLVLAVGMTYVVISGGFDLSIGSVLVFSGVAAALTMNAMGTDDWLTVLTGLVVSLACGFAWGVFNGLCIARLNVSALITTLGTMGAAQGAAYLITDGSDVRSVPQTLVAISTGLIGGVPWLVLITAVVATVGAIWLHMTRFGRHTYIVGSNAEAARRSGINVQAHLLRVYALSGMLAGFAAMLSLGRFATTTLEGHSTDPLEAITAVVLGGTSLLGGRGTIIGTVVGVFIPAVLANGFIIIGVQPYWQMMVIGFVVIGAVYIDQLKQQNRE